MTTEQLDRSRSATADLDGSRPSRPFAYSVVRAIRARPNGCSLLAETPTGQPVEIEVADRPDPEAAHALRRRGRSPLAVRIEIAAAGDVECHAFCTGAAGPRREPVTVGAGLALCVEGLHTVVIRRS